MKRATYMLMICLMICLMLPTGNMQAAPIDDDMRAVWVSTIFNLDYPSTKNNITAQQDEFIQRLDSLQAMGINTVIVQVRPKADALYRSSINPWSEVLTGVQGKDPGYDPMAFMIQEAHKRGMAFHAWLNPYRVTTSGTDLSQLSANHPARNNPSWTLSYGGKLYYNPEVEGVKQHIVETVKEIAKNYEVDGIHFDDYFYPSGYPLPSGEVRDGNVANMRRSAINDMVQRVSAAIKNVNTTYGKSIKFGISPPGIWKNSTSDMTGSMTSGNESYYSVYADSRTWIKNGWVDYIVPQIYWKVGHAKADYETLVNWWSNEVAGTNVKLYIGQGIYSEEVAKQIGTQLGINKNYSAVKGSIFFSLRNLVNDYQGCAGQIRAFYTGTANSIITNQEPTVNPPLGTPITEGTSSNTTEATNGALISAIGKTGTVTASQLNIRSGARVDRELIAQISAGTKVTILDALGDWYKVKLPTGKVGWGNATYLSVSNEIGTPDQVDTTTGTPINKFPCTGTVTATSLNVRSGARVDRELVTKLAKETKVTVLSSLNGWYKIRMADNQIGWASGEYIALSAS